MFDERIEHFDRIGHASNEEQKTCQHEWVYDGPYYDIGVTDDGGSFEEEGECYECAKCKLWRLKGTHVQMVNVADEIEDLLDPLNPKRYNKTW